MYRMKIALAHDHLISDGGAERVLKAFAEIWPDAPIYTLIYDPPKTHSFFEERIVKTSYLQKLPLRSRKYQWYLPLRPKAVESFNFDDFDVVLSNSSALMKGIRTTERTLHIDYCHTPTRFLWVDPENYLDPLEKYWPINTLSNTYKEHLKQWDISAAKKVNCFLTNTQNVNKRIKQHYQRNAKVIYPPVDTHLFSIADKTENYFLVGGRITSYKRFDLVIEAFNKLLIPLKVFGIGPWLPAIKEKAGPHIEFVGSVSEKEKAQLYAKAQAFIYPQVEDFGITAVESMASGRPVIAYREGGALETVVEGKTGVFFDNQDWHSLADAIIRFKANNFNPITIKRHADRFSVDKFKQAIKQTVESSWELHKATQAG